MTIGFLIQDAVWDVEHLLPEYKEEKSKTGVCPFPEEVKEERVQRLLGHFLRQQSQVPPPEKRLEREQRKLATPSPTPKRRTKKRYRYRARGRCTRCRNSNTDRRQLTMASDVCSIAKQAMVHRDQAEYASNTSIATLRTTKEMARDVMAVVNLQRRLTEIETYWQECSDANKKGGMAVKSGMELCVAASKLRSSCDSLIEEAEAMSGIAFDASTTCRYALSEIRKMHHDLNVLHYIQRKRGILKEDRLLQANDACSYGRDTKIQYDRAETTASESTRVLDYMEMVTKKVDSKQAWKILERAEKLVPKCKSERDKAREANDDGDELCAEAKQKGSSSKLTNKAKREFETATESAEEAEKYLSEIKKFQSELDELNGGSTYLQARAQVTPAPTQSPTNSPTKTPTQIPSKSPTRNPTALSTASPSSSPTAGSTVRPTALPTSSPSSSPTAPPNTSPSSSPTALPTALPSSSPTATATMSPAASPTASATDSPSPKPTNNPSSFPTPGPSSTPTKTPTLYPTSMPTQSPTEAPSAIPSSSSLGVSSDSAPLQLGEDYLARLSSNLDSSNTACEKVKQAMIQKTLAEEAVIDSDEVYDEIMGLARGFDQNPDVEKIKGGALLVQQQLKDEAVKACAAADLASQLCGVSQRGSLRKLTVDEVKLVEEEVKIATTALLESRMALLKEESLRDEMEEVVSLITFDPVMVELEAKVKDDEKVLVKHLQAVETEILGVEKKIQESPPEIAALSKKRDSLLDEKEQIEDVLANEEQFRISQSALKKDEFYTANAPDFEKSPPLQYILTSLQTADDVTVETNWDPKDETAGSKEEWFRRFGDMLVEEVPKRLMLSYNVSTGGCITAKTDLSVVVTITELENVWETLEPVECSEPEPELPASTAVPPRPEPTSAVASPTGSPTPGKNIQCPCLEEAATYRNIWLDATKTTSVPAVLTLHDQTEIRMQVNIENGNGSLLCSTIPTMTFVRGVCNFQAPHLYEGDYLCRSEGWTGSQISNEDGERVTFDTLSLEDFAYCSEKLKEAWGV